ncbi:hypothetical protein PSTG_17571 [Puccinia striiformis f. sp. tritici PST-78]|uniref:Uncharacterized protein n=1 Tax=Puccinia striiformis f. sp. tritici PST-78 TaxID=1165861 RepID=A0A0L0UPY4_9BASI|nr:hypothetical protein PSTG_17571 [Puccinia striiformis f. sp. tritici PST-78]
MTSATAGINCSDKSVRLVIRPACSSSPWTWPPNKRSDRLVRAVDQREHLLEQLSPTSCRTARSKNCLDRPAQELIGPACPNNYFRQSADMKGLGQNWGLKRIHPVQL